MQVRTCPQSNGDAALVDAVVAANPTAPTGLLEVRRRGGKPVLFPYVQVEDQGLLTAFVSMASQQLPAGPGNVHGTSYDIGQAMRELIASGAERLVIGLADSGTLDGGSGLIAALAGVEPHELPDADTARAAREMLRSRDVRLVAAYDTAIPLLGLTGAAAAAQNTLGLDPYVAQEAEARMSRWAQELAQVLPGRADLLTGKPHRHDRTPGSGAGGGAGFALAALGAELRPAAEVVAEATRLTDALAGSDLIVTGTLVFDWRQLTDSVVLQVGSQAQSVARPALVLAGRVDVGRRELMSLGFSGGYGVVQTPRTPLPEATTQILTAAEQLAHRVAGTWTPAHSSPGG